MTKILSIKKLDSLISNIPEELLYRSPREKAEDILTEKKKTTPPLKSILETQIKSLIEELRSKMALHAFMINFSDFQGLELFEIIKEEPLTLDHLMVILSVRAEKKDFFKAFIGTLIHQKGGLCLASLLEDTDLLLRSMPYTQFYASHIG
jgi:hypothetical protein